MNFNHAFEAFEKQPVAYGTFIASLLSLEGIFFLYFLGWKLLTILPMVGVVGCVTFISGSRALSEVQERRLAGKR